MSHPDPQQCDCYVGPLLCPTCFKLIFFKTTFLVYFQIVTICVLFVFHQFFDGFTITVLFLCRFTIVSNFFSDFHFIFLYFLSLKAFPVSSFSINSILLMIFKMLNFPKYMISYEATIKTLHPDNFSREQSMSHPDPQQYDCYVGPLLCPTFFTLFFLRILFLF